MKNIKPIRFAEFGNESNILLLSADERTKERQRNKELFRDKPRHERMVKATPKKIGKTTYIAALVCCDGVFTVQKMRVNRAAKIAKQLAKLSKQDFVSRQIACNRLRNACR